MVTSWGTWAMSWSRKLLGAVSVAAVACLAGGCAVSGNGDVESIYEVAKNLWNRGERVSLEQAASVPYASTGVRLGHSPETILLLATDERGLQLWTSAARIAITTRDGRIVRTAGFEHNLTGYESRNPPPEAGGVRSVRWQADFQDLGLYSIPISCRDVTVGDETIAILGKDIRTRRVDESCRSESAQLDWSFENTFWLDPASELVWRSIQHVHPRLDPIEMEILRPPS